MKAAKVADYAATPPRTIQLSEQKKKAREKKEETGPPMTREEKQHFLRFVSVLLCYLEQKDPAVYRQAKSIVHFAAVESMEKQGDNIKTLRSRLRKVVIDKYWDRAEEYLKRGMEQINAKKAIEQSKTQNTFGSFLCTACEMPPLATCSRQTDTVKPIG